MRKSIRQFETTIHCLADRWACAGPLLAGFPLLARGEPISASQIASAAGVTVDEVKRALESARCTFDEEGQIVDLFGLTLTPTNHRLEIEGREVFSCCALWAHVIPKLADRAVQVESVDPLSRDLVRITISPDEIKLVDPVGAMATMAITDADALAKGAGLAFCRHVRHFASADSAGKFAGAASSRRVVSIEELNEIAVQLHDAILGSVGGQP